MNLVVWLEWVKLGWVKVHYIIKKYIYHHETWYWPN